jgi:hypothetical protein
MQLSRRAILTTILLLTCLPGLSRSEDQRVPNNHRNNSMGSIFDWWKDKDSKENGIYVGRPKLFDNRDLEIMLDDLQRQLRGLSALDGDKVRAAIDNLQGYQARSQRFGLEVKPLALPGVTDTEEAKDGALAPKTRTSTTSEQKPVPPDLGAAPSLTLPVSNFGSSSQDLLTRQIDLQYQIDNVQMLLQRSVSDRFYDGGPADAKGERAGARLMVVVGFQISLTPEIEQRGMAAQVEIAIEPGIGKRRPSLVALMPQQKTYNSASLSKKSNAFGAVAPVSAFTVGASANSSGETFYLYQDTDTYAFESPVDTSAPNKLRFGWQFRPVLGRPAVEPGVRQLFAVIALDEKDGPEDHTGASGVNVPLKVTATTNWQRYKSKKRLPYGDYIMAHEEYRAEDFPVPYTWHLQKNLAPKITVAQMESIGEGKALVKIEGENFSRDTSVSIGDKILSPGSSAFVIRSNSQLQFVAPVADLLRSETTLTGGRYGFPALLKEAGADSRAGFQVKQFGPCWKRKGDYVELYVVLKPRQADGAKPDLMGRSVFIDFAGEIYEVAVSRWKELPNQPCSITPEDQPKIKAGEIWASIEVPYKNLETDSKLTAVIPFLGENYWSSAWSHPAVGVTKIVLLEVGASDASPMIWGLVGYGLDLAEPFIQVYADKKYTYDQGLSRPKADVKSPHLLYLSGTKKELSSVKEVTVFAPGYFEPKVFKAPTTNLPPPVKEEPKITNTPTVAKFSSAGVVFQGKSLKAIQKIEFEGSPLKHLAKSDEELTVFLTRAVTKETGPVSLLGYVDDTAFVTLNLTVQ